jgi:hypothetical protein
MYIFLIRQFPDLDHMVPIIHKMACDGVKDIKVLCQNMDYDIRNNFIVDYLKDELGIETTYSYEEVDNSTIRGFFSRLLLWIRRTMPNIGLRLFVRSHHMLYDEKWAENLLDGLKASALIFDYHRATKYSTDTLIKAARNKNIPIVLIPHAVPMRLSDLDKIMLPYADYKVFPNYYTLNFYKTDTDTERTIRILGSSRYCDEWEGTYNRMLEKRFSCFDLPDDNGKLKVLFFERPKIGFYEDHDSVQVVRDLGFVNTAYKGKPRIRVPSQTIAGSQYPSARLIQWADVVVMSISSIALEVLWQKKILIYIKYLAPDDVCVFDQYGACWTVNSQDELINALKTVYENPNYEPYGQENIEDLFRDVVYAGDRSRDILTDYSGFILSLNAGTK